MITLGIDPGLTGAVAALDQDHQVVMLEDLPTVTRGGGRVRREVDPAGLAHLLRPIAGEIRMAIVEQVASRPGQGVASVFSLGHTTGAIVGVLAALAVPYQMTTPRSWKKAAGLTADKDHARTLATRLYPTVNLSRVKDHNRAEALLLARHGIALENAA
jgi:crossover junction endodeoxyribonuclease RuvC